MSAGILSVAPFVMSLSRVCRVLVEGFWLEFLSLDLSWREVIQMCQISHSGEPGCLIV